MARRFYLDHKGKVLGSHFERASSGEVENRLLVSVRVESDNGGIGDCACDSVLELVDIDGSDAPAGE